MVANIASTVFSTGPTASTAAVDVYKGSGSNSSVVSSVSSSASAPDPSILGPLKGNVAGVNSTKLMTDSLLAYTSMSGKMDKTQILGRLANTSEISKIFGGLSKTAGLSIATGADALGLPKSVGASVGGIVSRIPVASLVTAYGMQSAINNLTGTNSFKITDRQSAGMVLGSVINQSNRLGVPGVSGVVLNTQTDKSIINSAVQTAINTSVKYGDITGIGAMIGLSTPGTAQSVAPSLINNVASDYVTSSPLSTSEKIADYTSSFTTFSNVDPKWNVKSRPLVGSSETEMCTDVSPIITDSKKTEGFNSLIVAGATDSADPKAVDYLAATTFSKMTVQDQLSNGYKTIPLNMGMSRDATHATVPENPPHPAWWDEVTIK